MSTYSYVNRVVPENWQGWYTRAIMEMERGGEYNQNLRDGHAVAIATQPTHTGYMEKVFGERDEFFLE
jgi:hypothetical protein